MSREAGYNHEGGILRPGKVQLELPFKPFTLDEVQRLTGCLASTLDRWAGLDKGKPLPLQHGCGVTGLNWMQAFAAYCGVRYGAEGASPQRASAVVLYVGSTAQGQMEADVAEGRSFPVPACLFPPGVRPPGHGMMAQPPDSPLGRRLNLAVLYAQFKERVEKVFGEAPKTVRE